MRAWGRRGPRGSGAGERPGGGWAYRYCAARTGNIVQARPDGMSFDCSRLPEGEVDSGWAGRVGGCCRDAKPRPGRIAAG